MECVDAAGDNARIRIKQFWSSSTHTHTRTHERMHACTNARTRAREHAPTKARRRAHTPHQPPPPSRMIDYGYLIGRKAGSSLKAPGGEGDRGMIEWTITFPALCVCPCVCVVARKLETNSGTLKKKYFLLPLYTVLHDA